MAKGCNIGNHVVTNPSGQYPLMWESFRELYNGQTIIIYRNNMTLEQGKCYINNPYNATGGLCYANNERGFVINYNPSDITCIPSEPVNVPLDGSIGYLFVIVLVIVAIIGIRGMSLFNHKSC